jgi:copper resistance protein D
VAEVLIVSRLLQFAAVIVVFGCGAFRLYGLALDTTTTSANTLITFDAWFWRVTIVGAIVALLSGLSLLLAVTANMAGSAAAALDPAMISTVLFDTSFGRVWCWRLLFAFLLIGACLAPLARRRMPAIRRARPGSKPSSMGTAPVRAAKLEASGLPWGIWALPRFEVLCEP